MAGPDFWIDSVLSVIIHEAAHVAIAWMHGVKIKRVGVSWRGPFIVREQGEPTADARIAIAGPLGDACLPPAPHSALLLPDIPIPLSSSLIVSIPQTPSEQSKIDVQ